MLTADESPIPCTRDPQRFTFHLPTTMLCQSTEPYSIHGVGTGIASVTSQLQAFCEVDYRFFYRIVRGGRPFVLRIECPGATGDVDESGCVTECCQNWDPRGEFISVVTYDENIGLKERVF